MTPDDRLQDPDWGPAGPLDIEDPDERWERECEQADRAIRRRKEEEA